VQKKMLNCTTIKKIMKTIKINCYILMLFVVSCLGLMTTGCKHTAHGAGEDIEQMGEKIQEKTS